MGRIFRIFLLFSECSREFLKICINEVNFWGLHVFSDATGWSSGTIKKTGWWVGGDDERKDWLSKHVNLNSKTLEWRNGILKCSFWRCLAVTGSGLGMEEPRCWDTQTPTLRWAQRDGGLDKWDEIRMEWETYTTLCWRNADRLRKNGTYNPFWKSSHLRNTFRDEKWSHP